MMFSQLLPDSPDLAGDSGNGGWVSDHVWEVAEVVALLDQKGVEQAA